MGLTGFNRMRKQALAEKVGADIADKLVSHGINEPAKLEKVTEDDLDFLTDEEKAKVLDSEPKEEVNEDTSNEDSDDYPDLSKDLPGREHFIEDGRYTTDDAIKELSKDEMTDVKYIGKATAEDIIEFYGG